jgi:hypothetical protein
LQATASQHYRPIYDTPFRVQTGRQAQAWYEHMSTCYDFFYALGADWDQTFSQASIATARDNLANSIPVQATERGAYYQLVAAMQQLSDRQKHVIHLLTEEMLARSEADALAFMRWVLIDWLARYSIPDFYGADKNWSLNRHRGYLLYTMAVSFER